MSARGFVCSIQVLPPSDGALRNRALAAANPSPFLSGAVALSLASEYGTLVQTLASSPLWQTAVMAELQDRAVRLQQLGSTSHQQSSLERAAALSSSLALLASMNGVQDELRVGARVSVRPLDADPIGSPAEDGVEDNAPVGTLVDYQAGRSSASVVLDAQDSEDAPRATVVSVARLQRLSRSMQPHVHPSASAAVLDGVLAYLHHALQSTSTLHDDARLLQQELTLYALRFLTSIAESPQHAGQLLERGQSLLPVLLLASKRVPAASSGLHASTLHLLQLERDVSRLRVRWLDLKRAPRWRAPRSVEAVPGRTATGTEDDSNARKEADHKDNTDNDQMAALLPFQPHARAAKARLPSDVAPSSHANSRFLVLETVAAAASTSKESLARTAHSSSVGVLRKLTFTRGPEISLTQEFLAGLGLAGRSSSSNTVRRLEEQGQQHKDGRDMWG
jgi:hypothetical protein